MISKLKTLSFLTSPCYCLIGFSCTDALKASTRSFTNRSSFPDEPAFRFCSILHLQYFGNGAETKFRNGLPERYSSGWNRYPDNDQAQSSLLEAQEMDWYWESWEEIERGWSVEVKLGYEDWENVGFLRKSRSLGMESGAHIGWMEKTGKSKNLSATKTNGADFSKSLLFWFQGLLAVREILTKVEPVWRKDLPNRIDVLLAMRWIGIFIPRDGQKINLLAWSPNFCLDMNFGFRGL